MKNYSPLSRFSFTYFLVFLISTFMLVFFSCTSPDKKALHITFAFGPDDAGTVRQLIDVFNNQHEGEIMVDWKETSRSTNEFYQQVAADFEAAEPGMDVIASDVIWTSSMADNGWAADLSKDFFEDYSPDDFVQGAMNSASYQFRIWGVPWFTDAGMLFYRKDLLEKHGYNQPPATWDELITVSKDIMDKEGTDYGYVFQGAAYEGGVTNACEFIWSAGGHIMLSDLSVAETTVKNSMHTEMVTINSPEALTGLETAKKIVNEGITPANIHEFKELEAMEAFSNGKAIFMRNWASAYGNALREGSGLTKNQVGVTVLPSLKEGMPSYSCLGGWNFMVNERISPEKRAAAWEFIRFMTSEKSQQYRAIEGGVLPSLRSLYQDEELITEVPVIGLAQKVLPLCRERPKAPEYLEMSPSIAAAFSRLLKGEYNAGEAMMTMTTELEGIMESQEE